MPNARDIPADSGPHKIFIWGSGGSGKTTGFLTLPGKKFAYLFDPHARLALAGHDVDFEEFLPDDMNLSVRSLAHKKGGDSSQTSGASQVYMDWVADYEERKRSGFFDPYQWIMMDSATTFLDLIMDRVLTINGRSGNWPLQDDWGPQMLAFTKVVRELSSNNRGLYFTGHPIIDKNEATKVYETLPLLTGQLKQKIPLLFSDIFFSETSADSQGDIKYTIRTVPTNTVKPCRSSLKGWDKEKKNIIHLLPVEDVTVDFNKPVEGQGIGEMINWEREYLDSLTSSTGK